MKATNFWKRTAVIATLLGILFPLLGEAGPLGETDLLSSKNCLSVTKIPISDFLDAQGTFNNPPQFFPPVKDYVGWGDGDADTFTTFGLVDYAGLANKYIKQKTGNSLGTRVRGRVIECELADGTAKIAVALFTRRALGFAQSGDELRDNGFDFLNTPTIFGNKAQDVVTGEAPAVGPVTLLTTFTISGPGTALPDFLDVINNPTVYAPVKVNFKSVTFGKRPDGTKARLEIRQVGFTNDSGVLVFPTETVEIIDVDY